MHHWGWRLFLLPVFLALSCEVQAVTLLFDDFESGALSPLKWGGGSQGIVVLDPIQGDHALRFTGLQVGGDLLSVAIGGSGSYILSFDYLGTCTHQDCGGFIGHEPGDVWDYGSQPSYSTTANPTGSGSGLYLVDDNTWHHYSISFTAGTAVRLQVEDYSESGGVAGDALFDNILVTSTPEPATTVALGLGLIGVALGRKRRWSADSG